MENIQSGGVYKFINAKAGNCMDLSGGDNTSVIGFDYHGGDNQKVHSLRYTPLTILNSPIAPFTVEDRADE